MENHGRTGQRTQKWQKVSGEISTPENSWRTTLSLFHLMKVLNDNDHCLGFGTWWPDHNWVFQFNISWWEGSCTGSWRGCPCQNTELPALMYLRGLCPTSYFQTKNANKGLIFTPTQHPLHMRDTQFVGGMSSRIFFDGWAYKWTIKDSVYIVQ